MIQFCRIASNKCTSDVWRNPNLRKIAAEPCNFPQMRAPMKLMSIAVEYDNKQRDLGLTQLSFLLPPSQPEETKAEALLFHSFLPETSAFSQSTRIECHQWKECIRTHQIQIFITFYSSIGVYFPVKTLRFGQATLPAAKIWNLRHLLGTDGVDVLTRTQFLDGE